MSYWDTSALVKLYAKETDSAGFENYLVSVPSPLVTARIALYEARATFGRKEREGILQAGAAQTLYNELLQDVAAAEVRFFKLKQPPTSLQQPRPLFSDAYFTSRRPLRRLLIPEPMNRYPFGDNLK